MIIKWIVLVVLVYPLVLLSRRVEFRGVSEMAAVIPTSLGDYLRSEFYRRTLAAYGSNSRIHFGTILSDKSIRIGNNVRIGPYNTLGLVDIGDDVLTAQGCHFLSGKRHHSFDRTDIPIRAQGGVLERITVGSDCWFGAGAMVLASVGPGAVVGAGSVVTKPVEPFSIVAGNPARPVGSRKRS